MGLILLRLIMLPIILVACTIGLTLVVEFPIIYCSGITKSKKYIVAVNALTNVCLNAGIVLCYFTIAYNPHDWGRYTSTVWTILAEAILIPVSEALLYVKVSTQSKKKVWILTYAANIASYIVGVLISSLLFRGGDGVSGALMKFLFGGL